MTTEPTAAEMRRMLKWMFEKTERLTGESCSDHYGFTWAASRVLFRYSRMKWGTDAPVFAVLAVWIDRWSSGDPFEDDDFPFRDIAINWDSAGGQVLRAIHESKTGKFQPSPLPEEKASE